ncbi:MAG: flagellar basal body P-ring protein FlgI [Spirochaetes bacterium]|nr:flagellar basal body P-ring protein FlgI [Spirochaetota bacterium]
MMRRLLIPACIAAVLVAGATGPGVTEVTVKVRDISFIDGLRENQVFGFGLVVGLQGSGDSRRSPMTQTILKNLLKNLGMEGDDVASKNCAAVLVTAKLPPFARSGDRVTVYVSSIGDAKSLEGGTLVQSSLKGGDNNTYVVAQGPLSVQKTKGTTKEVRTGAVITNGGIVEREISNDIVSKDNRISLVLKNWDYSVANDLVKAIQEKYPKSDPQVTREGKISLALIEKVSLQEYISEIEKIEITPSSKAKVVISEADGTIVTGGEVKISEALVSREGMTVEIGKSGKKVSAAHLKESGSVSDLVEAMNAVGATTKDMISILKALKDAGALHADLIVR